jgi:acyl carrier protein
VTREELEAVVKRVLGSIAPEADLGALDPGADLRESLDLDSMDFLNFLVGLREATGIEVPDRDVPRVSTLATCLDYLSARAADAGREGT